MKSHEEKTVECEHPGCTAMFSTVFKMKVSIRYAVNILLNCSNTTVKNMKLTSKRVKSAAKSTRIGKSLWHIIECTLELTQTEQNLSGHVTSVISSSDERQKKILNAAWPPTS